MSDCGLDEQKAEQINQGRTIDFMLFISAFRTPNSSFPLSYTLHPIPSAVRHKPWASFSSRNSQPVSGIRLQASGIVHPASRIQYQVSSILQYLIEIRILIRLCSTTSYSIQRILTCPSRCSMNSWRGRLRIFF